MEEPVNKPDNKFILPKDSLLTTSSGYKNYRGILNLILILLVLSNARAALENIIKYGILVDPLSLVIFFVQGSKHWPALLVVLNLASHILVSLLIEKFIAFFYKNFPEQEKALLVANVAIVVNLIACISLPPIVIYLNDTHPFSTSGSLMVVSIVFLKLVSYHMVNFWCRDMKRKEQQSRTTKAFLRSCQALDSLSIYPNNINLADICSYMIFPTLCYELRYERTERIRKRFLIKRIVELLVLLNLDIALVQQWIVPTVSNSVTPFRQMQYGVMLERLLKLAIPNHVIWLIWFYLFFHSLLNIIAELTRFADREFYRDWWNSESVYYFWANWNIPVHKWCARHLYIPMMSLGFNKCQASTAVFLVSAFFHEYLVSVPLKMFRMWAFTGMLIQLPWARFVSAYFNNQFANIAVWVSLIIGQPLCILMYYHDYYVINNNNVDYK